MTPKGWTVNYLSDLALKISDGIHTTPKYVDQSDIYFINGNNLKNGTIEIGNTTKNVSLNELEKHRKDLSDRTILMSINGTIGNLAHYKGEKVVLGKSAAYINVKDGTNKSFIYYALSSEEIQNYFISELTGSTIRNLSIRSIKSTRIKTPPLPEQTKIAQILSTWDQAIATTERLLANSQQQKQALMQQLLTGELRFPHSEGEWQEVEIGSIIKEVKRPVIWDDEDQYRLLSVKRRAEGVVLREILAGSQILTKKMNTARAGDFLISKMQVTHGAMGLVTEEFDNHHISDSYIAVIAKDDTKLDINFLSWLGRTKAMWRLAFLSSYGVHIEKLTFNFSLFLKEKIKIPTSLAEQQKIAQMLTTADAEIANLQAQLAKLKLEKKALMQQLLTGQRRVRLDDETQAQTRRVG